MSMAKKYRVSGMQANIALAVNTMILLFLTLTFTRYFAKL